MKYWQSVGARVHISLVKACQVKLWREKPCFEIVVSELGKDLLRFRQPIAKDLLGEKECWHRLPNRTSAHNHCVVWEWYARLVKSRRPAAIHLHLCTSQGKQGKTKKPQHRDDERLLLSKCV